MHSGIEHDSPGDPVNFLHRLDTVEHALIGAKFDFDPAWTLATVEVDSGISREAKYAWYLYHTIALLRQTVRRPMHESKPWFPQLVFYMRLHASLPRLDQYYREIQRIELDNHMNIQRCLLGILHLELLQILNPQTLPEIHHVWDSLQNGSPAYRNGFQTMPTSLHSKLSAYFHSLQTEQKIC